MKAKEFIRNKIRVPQSTQYTNAKIQVDYYPASRPHFAKIGRESFAK